MGSGIFAYTPRATAAINGYIVYIKLIVYEYLVMINN
jgi:hypothetical protein